MQTSFIGKKNDVEQCQGRCADDIKMENRSARKTWVKCIFFCYDMQICDPTPEYGLMTLTVDEF